MVGLLGANGVGKTTTMRMLATLLKPTSGTARIAGHDIITEPLAVRRQLGYLSATTGVPDRLTPREVLISYGRLHGLDEATIDERVAGLLAALGLDACSGRPCGRLSTGQRQRVSLGRALVHDPPALVLDEPTSGLDVRGARDLLEHLERLRSDGRAVLISTHRLHEIERRCDRFLIIDAGRIVASGTRDELAGSCRLARGRLLRRHRREALGMKDRAGIPSRRWRSILAVAHRDLLEFVRDRRTLFVTLLMPMAMYPVLALASTLGLRTALSDLEARQAPRQLVLILSGPEAVAFTARLKDVIRTDELRQRPDWPSKVAVEMVHPAQAQRLLDEGTADAWIQVAPGTMAALDGRGTVPLEARTSAIRPRDARRQAHLIAVMQALADDARQRRVREAGLPPSVLEPVSLSFLGGPQAEPPTSMEGIVPTAAGGVLVLLALLTATGAFYPAIDAIAGEKERGTIETLLIAPASPGEIVTGKFLAIWAVTLATLLVNALSIAGTAAVLLKFLPPGYDLGIDTAQTVLPRRYARGLHRPGGGRRRALPGGDQWVSQRQGGPEHAHARDPPGQRALRLGPLAGHRRTAVRPGSLRGAGLPGSGHPRPVNRRARR